MKDLPDNHIAHLFYLAQNAVVKASAPYPGKPDAPIENFVETLLRMKQVLLDCEARVAASAMSRKANGLPPPLVLMYGHSMAGAAIGVLTGCGKVRGFMHFYVSLAHLSMATRLNLLIVSST